MSKPHSAVPILLGIVLCCFTGCGEKRVDISGKVTYNGKPLDKPSGLIIFVPDKGDTTQADIGPGGEYRAVGVSAGHNRVVVYYLNPAAPKGKPRPKPGEVFDDKPLMSPFLTPEKYTLKETSELEVDAQPGTVNNVNMTGPPIP
jgi:hypothetical protein